MGFSLFARLSPSFPPSLFIYGTLCDFSVWEWEWMGEQEKALFACDRLDRLFYPRSLSCLRGQGIYARIVVAAQKWDYVYK